MTLRSNFISPEVNSYLAGHSTGPDEVLRDLAAETAHRYPAHLKYQTAPEMGMLLTLLTRMSGARDALEIGTFTGYSAIAIARGLGPGGNLLTCDVNEEWVSVARKYWDRAGLGGRIEARLGPALGTLRSFPEDETWDLAFIDADKDNYPAYWDAVVRRMRSGGVILVDNVLWYGRVCDPADNDDSVQAVRALNDMAHADRRVELVIVPIGDGLTVALKY
jgi:caffeoyl-CoA O-methyltransferase